MALARGAVLGPYRVVAPLGSGGMGDVYRAEDTRLGREVALKVLPPASREDPDTLARFAREARAVAALSHPNILAIFDVGSAEGQTYAVTELLEGETLRERLRRGSVAREEAHALARQLLEGLAAAHAGGIVHRDIKPENLFVTRDGRLKILDFGIARTMGRASGPDSPTVEQWRTETGLVLGTAAYMAPEQIAGRDVDARADLFAFGCVLAEMLAGRHPFRADTPLHVSARILRDPPDLDGVAEPERPLVTRALEKDPGRRFQSARDALDALARVVEAARQETITVRSPRRLIGAAAVLLLAAAAVVLWIRVPGAARDRLDSIAVLPLVNLSGDPAQEFFADGMTEAVIADLAQVASLKVISRTSVMQYKDTSKPLPQIARELGVAGIIEGSMRRSGDRVRVTAKLIHGSTEQHLWSRSYERELEDVLSLQSEVARAIAHEVRAAVTPAEAERLQQRARVNPEAFELYLRGRFEWNRRTRTSLLHAVELFEKAVETDPSYAQAWAGLADANAMLANSVYVPPDAAYGRALAAATRARELAPDLAEAHAAHGFLLFSHRHEWESAGESLRRAVALNPGYASAHQWLGAWTFLTNRRQETLAYLERAVALDPLAPRIRTVYGMYLFFLGQEDAALEQLQTAAPDDVQAHQFLADLHVRRGRLERAFLHARQVAADRRDGQLAAVHAAAGDRAEAERLLRETPPENLPPILRARVHVGLGRAESALNALLEAPTAVFLPYALGHPELAPVRQHPRFREFLRAVRLDRYYPE